MDSQNPVLVLLRFGGSGVSANFVECVLSREISPRSTCFTCLPVWNFCVRFHSFPCTGSPPLSEPQAPRNRGLASATRLAEGWAALPPPLGGARAALG